MRFTAVLIVAGVVGMMASGATWGQALPTDPAGIVKARQDFMGSLFKDYMRAFVPISKGESTDVSGVAEKATGLAKAVKSIPAYFPAGTGRDAVPSTRATPDVWTDRAAFDAKVQDFAKAAEKLADTAKTGQLDAIKAQIQDTFGACLGCHQGPAKSGGKFRYEAT